MRLPLKQALIHPDHIFLYAHDCRELLNPDARDFVRLMYLTRFLLVLLEAYARSRSRETHYLVLVAARSRGYPQIVQRVQGVGARGDSTFLGAGC